MATAKTNPKTPHGAQDEEMDVFPDLVYIELLAALVATVVLIAWSMTLDAPLRGVADPNTTENPAKAPWYFVGLQELLVYFDPWVAGVAMPTFIVIGLIMIPYVDPNRAGTGQYSFRGRRMAIVNFLFGFGLWFLLIIVGQWLRGPNWQFYWPWESWETAKSAEATLVNFPAWLGIPLVVTYFAVGLALPARLVKGIWKEMGAVRYVLAWTMVLLMYSVVIKVVLRLLFGVKYVVVTPWFNL